MKSEFVLLDIKKLNKAKNLFKSNDLKQTAMVNELIKHADTVLCAKPFTVTMKKQLPPSGNKHDYCSLATYWWPNPNTENGLPYIRKDGYVNPHGRDDTLFDRNKLQDFTKAVSVLSFAYFYTDDKKYFDYACMLLDTWFLNDETYMNPNLNYAQCIPGVCDGRDIGIIDTHLFIDMIDSINLLGYKRKDKLQNWFSKYLDWLLTSQNGSAEDKQHNNHGLWYDAQVLAFALFCEKDEVIKNRFSKTKQRLNAQIALDGSLPYELSRTRSYTYSFFAIFAMIVCAQIYHMFDLNLWEYQNEKSAGIKKCLDFMVPYILNESEWAWEQIDDKKPAVPIACFTLASKIYNDKKYFSVLNLLYNTNDDVISNVKFTNEK